MKTTFIYLSILISILCTKPLKAQEPLDKQFIVMSGYGYTHTEFVSGFANVNSFIYKYHKKWGAGLDIGTTIGRRTSPPHISSNNKPEMTTKINSLSIGPNIYYFAVDNSKHLVYINAGLTYTRKDKTTLVDETLSDGPNQYWGSKDDNVFGFNLSAGYTYKLTDAWGIGARCYFNHIEEAYTMGLLNVSISF